MFANATFLFVQQWNFEIHAKMKQKLS